MGERGCTISVDRPPSESDGLKQGIGELWAGENSSKVDHLGSKQVPFILNDRLAADKRTEHHLRGSRICLDIVLIGRNWKHLRNKARLLH